MAHKAPFVAYFRMQPFIGKRFEIIRSMQRAARLLYSDLAGNPNLRLAMPGGGESSELFTTTGSDLVNGLAIKPQMGDVPAQLMVAGFYFVSADLYMPHADKTIINANEYFTGPGGAQPARSSPVAAVLAEVVALKAIFDAAVVAEGLDVDVSMKLFRLIHKGIVFGDRGYSFAG